ncbi:hypothetical protein PWR66_07715 [Paraburkholderia sp. A1RO-5]|uniref:hypothetical protein n=1 Tax=Paraburkholderia sp. A1RO-5 TaxID=3028369 RepID=UPI003B799085
MMQKFDFTAPASGAPQVINAPGRYIKYVTGNAGGNDAGLIVTPGGKPGSQILLYPGQAVTLPDNGTAGPNGWTIANAIGAAQISGTVVIGNGKIDDNTLQGSVSVVDGGKFRTLAGAAFASTNSSGTPAAGKYAQLQLYNPAASGKRMVVESISLVSAAVATTVNVIVNAPKLTLIGTALNANKLAGGANPVAQWCADIVTASAPPVTGSVMFQFDAQANSVFPFIPKEPLVLLPGYGILFGQNTAAQGIAAMLEWYEEPNV